MMNFDDDNLCIAKISLYLDRFSYGNPPLAECQEMIKFLYTMYLECDADMKEMVYRYYRLIRLKTKRIYP